MKTKNAKKTAKKDLRLRIAAIVLTVLAIAILHDSIELRWLVPIKIVLPSFIFMEARLVEVSTKPSISWLIPITPCGQACKA